MSELSGNKKTGSDMRTANMSLILKTIRAKGAMSRADLARETGLMRSTVSSLTQALIEWNYVYEVGPKEEICVGKRAILLDICQDKIYVLSVKLSNNHIYIAKVNLRGNVKDIQRTKLHTESEEDIITCLQDMIKDYFRNMCSSQQVCYGIGIAVPSPVRNGEMLYSSTFSDLEGRNIREIVSKEFYGPIYVSNNADAAALAESWFAPDEAIDKLVFLLIDQGIGCGIFLDGEVYLGSHLLSNELGHVIVERNGPKCFCGNHGCLTSLASDWAVMGQVKKEGLSIDLPEEELNVEWMLNYTQKHPGIFLPYTDRAAEYMGVAIANMIDTITPDVIVIGGSFSNMPHFMEQINESCVAHVHPFFKDMVNIRKSNLKEDASLIGASTFLLLELYANPLQIATGNRK